MPFALLVLAFALVCAAVLGGCIPVGPEYPTVRELIMPEGADGPASKDASSTATTSTISPAMVGTWQSAGSWDALVIRTKTSSKSPSGAKAGKGKTFLLIETEFKNVKLSETLVVNPKDFTLKSPSGKKIAMVGTRPGYNGRGMREIGPGYGGGTVFVYKIPKGSAGYTFTFAPKVKGKRARLQWGVP